MSLGESRRAPLATIKRESRWAWNYEELLARPQDYGHKVGATRTYANWPPAFRELSGFKRLLDTSTLAH